VIGDKYVIVPGTSHNKVSQGVQRFYVAHAEMAALLIGSHDETVHTLLSPKVKHW
jgi:hypothetical protein